jgi:dihydroxyacetone kinase
MNTLLITTDTKTHAKELASFLKKVKSVKSVTISSSESKAYNWTNPSCPATDEEFESMIAEAEREIELGMGIPAETARKQTLAAIKKWKQKR